MIAPSLPPRLGLLLKLEQQGIALRQLLMTSTSPATWRAQNALYILSWTAAMLPSLDEAEMIAHTDYVARFLILASVPREHGNC